MKKTLLIIFILAFAVSFGFGQEKRFQVSFFGGLIHVFEYGSEDDYKLGKNDFPLTPAHTPADFGVGFTYFFMNHLGVALDGRYTLTSKVTLQDPSDQDTVEINASRHYSLTLNFICQFLSGRFRPYLVVGSGFDKLLAKEETYTTEHGYEVEFLPPEGTIDPVYHLGCGVDYFLGSNIGTRLDVRYIFIFDDPHNVKGVNVMFGAFFRF